MSDIPQYSVQAFRLGDYEVPGAEVTWMENWTGREVLVNTIFLIRGHGRNILINTGAPQDLTELNEAWRGFFGFDEAMITRTGDEYPQKALERVGLKPEDIDMVIITPIQIYATANITLFPNARVCISRKGWIEDWCAPTFHLHVPRHLRLPRDQNDYLQNEGWGKLQLLEDEAEILPGLSTFWVGGHHRSSIAVKINTSKGQVIVSDCFFTYANIEQHKYLGVMESMPEIHHAYERIRREGDILLPLYDPEIFERFPDGIVAEQGSAGRRNANA